MTRFPFEMPCCYPRSERRRIPLLGAQRSRDVGGRAGFTLVEIAVVLSLVAILAAIAVPIAVRVTANARIAKARADVTTLATAVGVYNVHCGGLPPVGSASATSCPTQAGDGSGGVPFGLTLVQQSASGGAAGPLIARLPALPQGWKGTGTGYTYTVGADSRFSICASGDGILVTVQGGPECRPGGALVTPDLKWRFVAGKWKDSDGTLTGNGAQARALSDVPGPDYTFGLDMQTSPKGKNVWDVSRVLFRYQDADNYYALVPKTDGTVELAKMQNGKWSPLLASAKAGTDPAAPHRYEVTVSGNRVQASVDGKAVIDFTDSNAIQTGGVGVANEGSSATFSGARVTMGGS